MNVSFGRSQNTPLRSCVPWDPRNEYAMRLVSTFSSTSPEMPKVDSCAIEVAPRSSISSRLMIEIEFGVSRRFSSVRVLATVWVER